MIFPRGDKVILKRKTEKGIQTATIGFDFEEMTFYAEQNSTVIFIETFNEFLISGLIHSLTLFIILKAILIFSSPLLNRIFKN